MRPLIVTPRRLSQFSEFYHQLGTMLTAGVTPTAALEHQLHAPPGLSFRLPIRSLLKSLNQGATFTESLCHLGGWLPAFDLALIGAGEQSGRLDVCCKLLATYYSERSQLGRRVMLDLAYPAFLLHAAVFIFPFADFFLSHNWLVYLTRTLGVLLPIYAVHFLLLLACQGRHGETWRSLVEQVLAPMPVLGSARRGLALARLAAALESLINAGVSIIDGWELAAAASGSPALNRVVQSWKPRLISGETPGDLVAQCRLFPPVFASLYKTGEVSGSLDDALKRLHVLLQEESSRKLHAVAEWMPRLAYLVILFMVAYRIVVFWTGYFAQINEVM